MKKIIQAVIDGHKKAVENSFDEKGVETLEAIAREILKTLKAGGKILLCGNGGSASDAQHIAAEFVGRFVKDRQSLPAIALTTDTSALTAIANDYSFEQIFARQIEGLARKGDLLIAISTSGESGNVIEAVCKAKSLGLFVVGFSGAKESRLSKDADCCFQGRAEKTAHVQEIHITALHAICEIVDSVLFG